MTQDAMCYPLQEVIREAFPDLRFATGQIIALQKALEDRFGQVIVKATDREPALPQLNELRQHVIGALAYVEQWETEIPHDHPLRRMIDHLRKSVMPPDIAAQLGPQS